MLVLAAETPSGHLNWSCVTDSAPATGSAPDGRGTELKVAVAESPLGLAEPMPRGAVGLFEDKVGWVCLV